MGNARRHYSVARPDTLQTLASDDNLVTWLAGAGTSSGKPQRCASSRRLNERCRKSARRKNELHELVGSTAGGATRDLGWIVSVH